MVRRRGLGATVASAFIFSVLLASSFWVYYSAEENDRLHLTSNAADAIADDGLAFEGVAGTNVLLTEQAFLESNVLQCGSALATVSGEINGLTDSQASANLTVVTGASQPSQGPALDNLSMLAPFGGFVGGVVDTALHEEMKGDAATLGVSYAKNETHYVHLPVRIADMTSDCDSALSDARRVASAATPPQCAPPAVYHVIAEAVGAVGSKAIGSGLRLAVNSTIVGTAPCSVDVTVEVSQAGIAGPGGIFGVNLRGEEFAVFGSRAGQQPA
jgi:hypothetical protein